MLKRMTFINYRGFRHFRVDFTRTYTLLVGRNNAGKSTILEAVRLVGDVLRTPGKTRFRLESPCKFMDETFVYTLEAQKRGFTLSEVRHNDVDEDAAIIAEFKSGPRLIIVFPVDEVPFYAVEYANGRPESISAIKTRIVGLPAIGLLAPFERGLSKDHVRASATTGLASRHFRNYWNLFPDRFEQLNQFMNDTWGATLMLPQMVFHPEEERYVYQMMCREEDGRLREIARLGAGFQVWIQLVSHLVRYNEGTTIVLDEPDAHLHSDLQRKLIGILKNLGNRQVVIATHSPELINEAGEESLIYIDRQLEGGKRLNEEWSMNQILSELGVSESHTRARVARSRVCFFVEGQDPGILRRFAETLGLLNTVTETQVSWVPLFGQSNWEKIFTVPYETLRNMAGQDIVSCVILDRDFRTESQVSQQLEKLRSKVEFAFVWSRKELENYLLNPVVIHRAICDELNNRQERTGESIAPPSLEEIAEHLNRTSLDQRHFVHSRMLDEVQKSVPADKKGAGVTETFNRTFEELWANPEMRLEKGHGKKLLDSLFNWTRRYKVSLSPGKLAETFLPDEIPEDIKYVIESLAEATRKAANRF